jgi:serine/threonine-protein kinase SRK2
VCAQASGEGKGNGGYAQEIKEMLEKMKTQDYYLPDSLGLTPECKGLLQKLLHPDWSTRIKVAGIMADPWFQTDLPPDALNMNDRYIANTRTCTQSEDGEWLAH